MSQVNPEFTNKIKAWVSYEMKQQELKSQIAKLNEAKESLSNDILQFMRNNNLQRTAINVGNNRICYYDESQYNNLSFAFLKECLMIYFNGDESKTTQICDFIKTKRTKNYKSGLKMLPRKINSS
jgi:hypothetical protein